MKLALQQAAERLGVHPDTLKRWGDKGPQFTRTAGGHRRYDTDTLDAWIEYRALADRVNEVSENLFMAATYGAIRQPRTSALPTLEAKAEAEARIRADLGHIL